MSASSETGVLPNTTLCSLPEQPRELRCDLHPTRPWVLASPDTTSADGDSRYAAIFDYKRRTLVFAIHPEDQSQDRETPLSPSSSTSSTASMSVAAAAAAAVESELAISGSVPSSSNPVLATPRRNTNTADAGAAASSAAGAAAAASTGDAGMASGGEPGTPRAHHIARSPSMSRAVPVGHGHSALRSEQQKAPGTLRFMRFFDSDVRSYKRLSECSVISSESSAIAAAKQLTASSGAYVIVVYDNRVILFNYVSGSKTVTYLSELRGVPITALEVFSSRGCVAFGGSDGSVRIWNVDRREIVAVLTGGHKASTDITSLLSFTDDRGGIEYLVSGASDGTLCLWNIAEGKLEGAASKAHDGAVTGITLRAVDHVIVTAGDKGLVEWTYSESGLTESRRSLSKRPTFGAISAGTFCHSCYPADCILTLRKDSSEIYATNFDQTDYRPLTTFSDIHGSAKKDVKGSKIYTFVVHPVNPDIFAISTAKGAFVVRFEQRPDSVPCAFTVSKSGQKVFYEKGCNVLMRTLGETAEKDSEELNVASGLRSENVQIQLFNRGQVVFCVFPGSQTFAVASRPNSSSKFTLGEEKPYRVALAVANGKCVAAAAKDRFAMLEVSGTAQTAPNLSQSKRGAPAVVTETLKLSVYQLTGGQMKPISDVPAKMIKNLFSGQLLGVVFGASDSKEKDLLQFYNWSSLDDLGKVCGPLPAPERVVWDPERPQVALLYKHSFVLYQLEPGGTELNLIMSHNDSVTSLLWSDKRVYTVSRDYIKCYFYDVPDMPVIIASRMGDCAARVEEAPSQHLPMPIGPIELLGETATEIVAMDYNRRMHRYPTASNHLLSTCILATQGKIKEALESAKNLHPHFHEAVALFLVRRGFVRESLQLEGLTAWWKLKYCLSNILLSDSVAFLKKAVEEYQERMNNRKQQCGFRGNGLMPFINLYDLTQPSVSSEQFCGPEDHPTKDELMTVAGELAASCRSYSKPADAKAVASLTETGETATVRGLAQSILDTVSSVDPARYFMLVAVHLVLTKSVGNLTGLSNKVKEALSANSDPEEVEKLKSALLFINSCIDDPNLISAAWSKIAPAQK